MEQPCTCEKKCFEVSERKYMENIFNDFWNMGDHEKRNAYLLRQVRANPTNRKYTHSDISRKKRATTNMYGLLLVKKQNFVEQPFYLCMAFKKTKEV